MAADKKDSNIDIDGLYAPERPQSVAELDLADQPDEIERRLAALKQERAKTHLAILPIHIQVALGISRRTLDFFLNYSSFFYVNCPCTGNRAIIMCNNISVLPVFFQITSPFVSLFSLQKNPAGYWRGFSFINSSTVISKKSAIAISVLTFISVSFISPLSYLRKASCPKPHKKVIKDRRKVYNPEFKWTEDDLTSVWGTVNGTVTDSATSVTLDDASFITVGDILRTAAGEQILVTAINGNALTVIYTNKG